MSEHPTRIAIESPHTCYYEYRAAESSDGTPPLVVGLHGFGQNCGAFARRLAPLTERGIAVAAVQGPHQFYLDIASKKVGFNWLTAYEKDDAIPGTVALVDRVRADVAERTGCDPARVYLLGFSQGTSMAWRYALRTNLAVSGVIACCADLAPDVAERLPDHDPFDTLLVYGTDDGLIPQDKIDEAMRVLEERGWPHDTLEFEGGHELDRDTMQRIGDWIATRGADAAQE